MKHARVLCNSFLIMCVVSDTLKASRNEFKKREKRSISSLTTACRDNCSGDA